MESKSTNPVAARSRRREHLPDRASPAWDQTGKPEVNQACTPPPQRADAAQARLFDYLLEAELVELQAIDARRNRRRRHYARSKADNDQPPEPLMRYQQELDEVRCLLTALRTRFTSLTEPAEIP